MKAIVLSIIALLTFTVGASAQRVSDEYVFDGNTGKVVRIDASNAQTIVVRDANTVQINAGDNVRVMTDRPVNRERYYDNEGYSNDQEYANNQGYYDRRDDAIKTAETVTAIATAVGTVATVGAMLTGNDFFSPLFIPIPHHIFSPAPRHYYYSPRGMGRW